MSDTKSEKNTGRLVIFLLAGLAAIAGFLAVYGNLAPSGNAPEEQYTLAKEKNPEAIKIAKTKVNKFSQGKMAGFVYKKTPADLPDFSFKDAAEKERTIADWKGKVVLLNLWATWCAPCREEMPALDRLNKELKSDDFEVVALSIDRGGLKPPKKFLEKIGIESLALYNDKSSKSATKLKAFGMPTTLLISKDGKEIGRLTGPAEWDHADAKALIKDAISK